MYMAEPAKMDQVGTNFTPNHKTLNNYIGFYREHFYSVSFKMLVAKLFIKVGNCLNRSIVKFYVPTCPFLLARSHNIILLNFFTLL